MAVREPSRVGEGRREAVDLSVIVPVLNEASTLEELAGRLLATLHRLGKSYEVIFVDDGSTDETAHLLKQLYELHATVRVIRLNRNYGQHPAILAAFERACGEVIVTLDGDLQNPPEEIPRLLEKIQEGYDVVGGWRASRQDSLARKIPSWFVGKLASRLVDVRLRDHGCMLRAYRRPVIEQLLRCQDHSMYIPALANSLAASVAEVAVAHHQRTAGRSRYDVMGLLGLAANLVMGFSLLPIRLIALTGALLTVFGSACGLYAGLQSWRGTSTPLSFVLIASVFFVGGLQLLALGVVGEYVGRAWQDIRRRPRYVVREIWE